MAQFPFHGRPVGQRSLRGHGFVSFGETVALTLGSLAIALSLPTITVVAGGTTVAAGSQTLTLSAPTASVAGTGTPGTSVPVPYGRPVSQYGIRWSGPSSVSTTPEIPTNQSATLDPLALAISVPAVVRYLPPIVGDPGPINVALSLPTATLAAGTVTHSTGQQFLALSLPDVVVDAGSGTNVSTPVPYLRAFAQRGIRTWGQASPSTTPETVFNQTLEVTPAAVALSLPDVVRLAPITLTTTRNVVALSLPDVSFPVAGTPGISAEPATILRKTIRARTVRRSTLIASHGVIEELAPETQTRDAGALVVTLKTGTVARIAGTVTNQSGTNVIALSLPTVAVVGGGTGNASMGSLAVALTLPSVSVTVSGTTVGLTPAVAALSLPAVVPNQFVVLTPAVVTLSLPTAAPNQAAVRGTGLQTIALSLPDVTATVSNLTLAAGDQILVLSLPDVERIASSAGFSDVTVTVALSLPDVSVTVGAAPVDITPIVVSVRMARLNVLGATELPTDVFEGTLQSRHPEYTLASRHPDYTLRFRG